MINDKNFIRIKLIKNIKETDSKFYKYFIFFFF